MFITEKEFSNKTLPTPIEKHTKKAKKYLKLAFEVFFSFFKVFKRLGIVPKISPIKIELVCIGNEIKKYCKKLLKMKTPINIPIKIGNKNLKFFLTSLKKYNILSYNFS